MESSNMFCALCILTYFASAQSNTYEIYRTLQSDLLKNYSKDIRPVTTQTDVLDVNISFRVKTINKFDEIEGVLHLVIGLTLTWRDELIQWIPSNFGQMTMVRLPMSKVWTPSFFLINSATDFHVNLGDHEMQTVKYSADGSALLSAGIITSSTCSPIVTYYPFDTHDCNLEISSFLHEREISLHIDDYISTLAFEPNTIWELRSVYGHGYLRGNMSMVKAEIKIKRRPTFLLINIFAPILFLASANLFVFAIPVESGERISFAVTILLSFAVFLTLVTDKMPQTSLTVSLFSVYLLVMITYSSLIILALVFILGIYYIEDEDNTRIMHCLICILEKRLNNSITIQSTIDSELDGDIKKPTKEQKGSSLSTTSTRTNRMKKLASALDRICVLFFSVFFILASVIFMSILAFA